MFLRKFGVLEEGFIKISHKILMMKKNIFGKGGVYEFSCMLKGFSNIRCISNFGSNNSDYCIMLKLSLIMLYMPLCTKSTFVEGGDMYRIS